MEMKKIQVVERNYNRGASYHLLTATNRSLWTGWSEVKKFGWIWFV